MNMARERGGDLLISQGQFVFIQDGASGLVAVAKGPHKESLAETDRTVMYDAEEMRFFEESSRDSVQVCPTAKEGQYIMLHNPSYDGGKLHFPTKGKTSADKLDIGHKINMPGPISFALFPEQVAEVLDGHQLKSNEYLVVRVYNDVQAKTNLEDAVIKTAGEGSSKKSLFNKNDIDTGKLFIIKGTDVSFFIPPTGFEVLPDENGEYTRAAVTLERLEYAILLDENGDKDYSFGPKVVFPKPTQNFVEKNGNKKFRAIELNDDMGIYIKVIADYNDGKDGKGGKEIKAGEELFVTGKEQKIYFPRPEQAIIKYGARTKHYAIVIPKGEARYVLDKEKGTIDLIKGPKTFLPDPRKQVIVKRVLDTKTVKLWFPGNEEAIAYNQTLEQEFLAFKGTDAGARGFVGADMVKSRKTKGYESNRYTTSLMNSFADTDKSYVSSEEFVAEEMTRGEKFTKPRQITLDTKYDGSVMINVWPGYAVQIVKKTGERRVVIGPKVELLEFDETLERLSLSTGTPKNDERKLNTAYLQIKNNKVSDAIDAETKDLVNVGIVVSYRVNFNESDSKKWFDVSNYVKLLTEHMRSMVRNEIKKIGIETFNTTGTDIIRDLILGKAKEGKERPGRSFAENGMKIYDVEVLNIEIGDRRVNDLLREAQNQAILNNIQLQQNEKKLEMTKKTEEVARQILSAQNETHKAKHTIELSQISEQKTIKEAKAKIDEGMQPILDKIALAKMGRYTKEENENTRIAAERLAIEVKAVTDKAKAVDPKLADAITLMSGVETTRILAQNLKEGSALGEFLGKKGGIDGLLDAIKGTPMHSQILNVLGKLDKKYPSSK